MNRKLLTFILSAALLFTCVGFLSSCKDTSEDQFAKFKSDLAASDANLKAQLAAAQQNIKDLNAALEALKASIPAACTCDLSDIIAKINALQQALDILDLSENKDFYTSLPETIINLETQIAEIQKTIHQEILSDPRIEPLLQMADVENLKKVLESYKVATLPDALEKLIRDVTDLKNLTIPTDLTDRVEGLEDAVAALQEELGLKANQEDLDQAIEEINAALEEKAQELQDQIDALVDELTKKVNQEDFDELNSTVGDLKDSLQELIDADFQGQIDAINDTLTGLDEIYAKVEDLKTIEDRLNSIINSIVIQQVTNKVFGSLLLPLGVETNILMAYHGYNDSGLEEFPSDYTSYEYNAGDAFDYSELQGVTKVHVGNILLDESANNAGTVYYTINPSNVNLKNSVFTLVNSLDKSSGIELSKPVASNKLLTFGWSRADNGFYYSSARLPEENLDKLALSIGDDLKKEIFKAAKNFLYDLRHLDRPDLSQIASVVKDVLQRFNGKIAANAIKGEYTYTDLEGNTVKAATYSNYGIAALTFQPQSFCFLEGQENKFDRIPELPTISDFEFDMGEVKIEFKTSFKVNGLDVELNFDKLTFNPDDLTVTGYVTMPDGTTQPVTAKVDGLDKVAAAINAKLEEIVGQVNDDIIQQVNDIVAQINKEVEDMLEKMSADVNSQLNDLMADLSDEVNDQMEKYTDRINSLIKKANKLIARVNNVLAHPNRYLQPLGIYTGTDGELHLLSTSKIVPSKFNLNGGNATTLYFTSYTLEAIAPAYKKYVKVVNAWKNDDASRTTVASAVNNANAKGSLNQVVGGDQIRFAFAPEAGYTYEIVFQALDYQGFTSTHRCFIEVR